MLWTDVKYAKQLAYRLERFKVKNDTGSNFNAQCRCPLCGDSEKSKTKTRGNLYTHEGELFYKCFNCDASLHFSSLLKQIDLNMYKQYIVEKFGDRWERPKIPNIPKSTVFEEHDEELAGKEWNILEGGQFIKDMDDNHPAKQYVIKRKIPEQYWSDLFYVTKFFEWSKSHTTKFEKIFNDDHPRLIIPWFDENKKLFAYQARAFGPETPKYYTIILDKSKPKIYGLDRLHKNKRINVFEGPIDSMCVPNSVAVGCAALNTFDNKGLDVVYCYDNQPRNKEIVKLISNTIDEGKTVCLMSEEDFPWKDMNEAIIDGQTSQSLSELIHSHSYSGLVATMKFNNWKRV